MVMHRIQAEVLLPPEVVASPEKYALLMADAGDHAEVWLCEFAHRPVASLTVLRRLDLVPRGERHKGGLLPNSEVFRAGASFKLRRYHARGQRVDRVPSPGTARIVNLEEFTRALEELQGVWSSSVRLGIHPRKIKETLGV